MATWQHGNIIHAEVDFRVGTTLALILAVGARQDAHMVPLLTPAACRYNEKTLAVMLAGIGLMVL